MHSLFVAFGYFLSNLFSLGSPELDKVRHELKQKSRWYHKRGV